MWTDITRAKHARKGLRYSSDLTDAEWAVIEPRLPERSGLGRPPKWSRRTIVNGMLYVLRSGLPWRLPKDFPPVSTVQRYFYAWRERPVENDQPFSSHGLATDRRTRGLAQRRGNRQSECEDHRERRTPRL